MRKLSLKKETLAELSPVELGNVVGAMSGLSCPAAICNNSDFVECMTGVRCVHTLPAECMTGTTVDTLGC
jgi:hypothetical protein